MEEVIGGLVFVGGGSLIVFLLLLLMEGMSRTLHWVLDQFGLLPSQQECAVERPVYAVEREDGKEEIQDDGGGRL